MVKILLSEITYGTRSPEPDPLLVLLTATELNNMGYRGVSNAYSMVARIDRDDWLDVLATERRCSRADFYNVDGSGIGDRHIDYYVRVHSKDHHTVHPDVYRQLRRMQREAILY